MKKLTFIFLILSIHAIGQDSLQVRTFGAAPSDLTTLSNLTIAFPQSGAAGTIPSSSRMDDECPPVSNQCLIGSCVSQATAYGLCGILARRQNIPYLFSPMYMHFNIKQPNQPSPPDCYVNDCRCMGSSLGLAANYLMNNGIPSLDNWGPNQINQCDVNSCKYQPTSSPSIFRLTSAKPLFLPGYQYNPGYKTNAIRYYIFNKYPVPIAMELDRSFANGSAFNNPSDTWQFFQGNSVGGHAMLIVGYDDNRAGGSFLVMNSWGTTNWNLRRNDPTDDAKLGYCWISYSIIENHAYEAFVANEPQTGYAVTVSELLRTTNLVKNPLSEEKKFKTEIQFFIENRYNQYDSIRFIPIDINKAKDEATVAIYKIRNGEPILYTAFKTNSNKISTFNIDNRKFIFKALYIKPWRKYLGIFKGGDALFYQLSME